MNDYLFPHTVKTFFLSLTLALMWVHPLVVHAEAVGGNAPSLSDNLQEVGRAAQYDAVSEAEALPQLAIIIGRVIGAFLSLLGIIFVLLIIHAGYLWLMAGGNEDQVGKAKIQIRNAIIGIVIVVAAYAITYFVLSVLGDFNDNLNDFGGGGRSGGQDNLGGN